MSAIIGSAPYQSKYVRRCMAVCYQKNEAKCADNSNENVQKESLVFLIEIKQSYLNKNRVGLICIRNSCSKSDYFWPVRTFYRDSHGISKCRCHVDTDGQ